MTEYSVEHRWGKNSKFPDTPISKTPTEHLEYLLKADKIRQELRVPIRTVLDGRQEGLYLLPEPEKPRQFCAKDALDNLVAAFHYTLQGMESCGHKVENPAIIRAASELSMPIAMHATRQKSLLMADLEAFIWEQNGNGA